MSYVSVRTPRQYITTEILTQLLVHFPDCRQVFDADLDIMKFESTEIKNGRLPVLEAMLVARKAPFDRYTGSPECERKYRPGKYDEVLIDIEINRVGGNIMIDTYRIQDILSKNHPPSIALAEIRKLLNDVEPLASRLEDWIGIDASMISTAEVEMTRFTDIL